MGGIKLEEQASSIQFGVIVDNGGDKKFERKIRIELVSEAKEAMEVQ